METYFEVLTTQHTWLRVSQATRGSESSRSRDLQWHRGWCDSLQIQPDSTILVFKLVTILKFTENNQFVLFPILLCTTH